MKYNEHEMEIVLFDENNTFVVTNISTGDDDGYYTWSIRPDRSDS